MRLAIVGGGPAGLVAALASRRLGIDAVVFEQAQSFGRVGGGIALQSNGLRVLDALGVLNRLRPAIQLCRTLTIERVGVGPLLTLDVGTVAVPHNRFGILPRHVLHETLLASVRASGVPVLFDRRCGGAEWEGGRVVLRFGANSEPGFDAVVAADGIHSVLRASAGLSAREYATGWAALRGVVDFPHANDTLHELWGSDGRLFGSAPLPGGRRYFYCSAPIGRWKRIVDEGGLEAWIESWCSYGPEVVALLRAVSNWRGVSYDEIREVKVRKWYRPPGFLVGDAAHAMTPNLGQGANSAMVDALVVVHLLAESRARGLDVEWVGRRYQRIRRRFVTLVQTTSRWTGCLPSLRPRVLRIVADAMLRLQDRVPPLKRRAAILSAGHNSREEPYLG